MAKFFQKDTLKDAEALGQLASLPEAAELKDSTKEDEKVCSTPEDFRMAIGRAQMDGLDYVEVTDDLFSYLVKNQKTPYLTYGDPGIKVFKTGTRAQILQEESMNAEDHANMMARRKIASHNN